jgi:hypothetical protein
MNDAPAAAPRTASDREADSVHAWRVSQLTRLGLATPVAEDVADRVNWHEIANLVERGCPADLAVAIVE